MRTINSLNTNRQFDINSGISIDMKCHNVPTPYLKPFQPVVNMFFKKFFIFLSSSLFFSYLFVFFSYMLY